MEQLPANRSEAQPPPPQVLHQSDVDEDDENVKQLDECSSLYRLMQVNLISLCYLLIFPSLNPKPSNFRFIELVDSLRKFFSVIFRIALFEQTGIGKNARQVWYPFFTLCSVPFCLRDVFSISKILVECV